MKKEKLEFKPGQERNIILSSPPPYNKLMFNVEEIIIRCGKLRLKLPQFWDLKDVDEITFQFEKEKHVYKKVK